MQGIAKRRKMILGLLKWFGKGSQPVIVEILPSKFNKYWNPKIKKYGLSIEVTGNNIDPGKGKYNHLYYLRFVPDTIRSELLALQTKPKNARKIKSIKRRAPQIKIISSEPTTAEILSALRRIRSQEECWKNTKAYQQEKKLLIMLMRKFRDWDIVADVIVAAGAEHKI